MSTSTREIDDPLLRDLSEKKQSFRRNVVSLAAELKDVRIRLSSQQESFAKESVTRHEAEARAKDMEQEISRLQKSLDDRNQELEASSSDAQKYLRDLDNLTSQLSFTKTTAEASAASAQSAQLQCESLLKELDQKNRSLKEFESCVNKLGEQLNLLQTDLESRESSQKQLKHEVTRVEHDIMQALAKSGANNNDCELRRILDDVSPRNVDKMNKLLSAKDEEIAKLRDEIRVMSVHWNLKSKDLESQLEKHRRADQELKKRVLKLEFCLHEARAQTRKLQRTGERRDKTLKDLRDELSSTSAKNVNGENDKFWESSGFKIAVSMSMLILVMFSKRNATITASKVKKSTFRVV